MIVAIGTDGTRPVVWGLGETRDEARTDALQTEETWGSGGRAYIGVPDHVAARVLEGQVDCNALGITVDVRNGRIVAAEYTGAKLFAPTGNLP